MLDSAPVIIDATKDHIVATFENIVLMIYEREALPQSAAPFTRALDAVIKQFPERAGILTVVADNAPVPSSEARQLLASAIRTKGQRLKASAVCFEGTGFSAAAARGVIVGLSMLVKPSFPNKVFSSLNDAATWLSVALPKPVTAPRSIIRAIEIARGDITSIPFRAR